MDDYSLHNITIDDFQESDFGDPITLLDALLKRGSAQTQIAPDFQKDSDYYTVSQLSQEYHLDVEDFMRAISNGELVADKVVPLFSKKVVEAYLSGREKGSSVLYDDFMREMAHMRVNYSYKPILIMAILKNASTNGEVTLSDLVDFFLDYYAKRQDKGLPVEKADSSFVKYPNDRKHAAKTIIRYPITVLSNKQFMTYDFENSVLTVAKPIWSRIDMETKAFIGARCERILQEYYSVLV